MYCSFSLLSKISRIKTILYKFYISYIEKLLCSLFTSDTKREQVVKVRMTRVKVWVSSGRKERESGAFDVLRITHLSAGKSGSLIFKRRWNTRFYSIRNLRALLSRAPRNIAKIQLKRHLSSGGISTFPVRWLSPTYNPFPFSQWIKKKKGKKSFRLSKNN